MISRKKSSKKLSVKKKTVKKKILKNETVAKLRSEIIDEIKKTRKFKIFERKFPIGMNIVISSAENLINEIDNVNSIYDLDLLNPFIVVDRGNEDDEDFFGHDIDNILVKECIDDNSISEVLYKSIKIDHFTIVGHNITYCLSRDRDVCNCTICNKNYDEQIKSYMPGPGIDPWSADGLSRRRTTEGLELNYVIKLLNVREQKLVQMIYTNGSKYVFPAKEYTLKLKSQYEKILGDIELKLISTRHMVEDILSDPNLFDMKISKRK